LQSPSSFISFNSSNPEERRALVSDDFSKSHISVQLRNAGSEEYKDFFDEIQKDINNEFNKLTATYPELKVQITGSFALMMRLADDISKNQFKSLAIAAVVISLLMMLTLGSLQAGVISIVPNLIPATLAFGLMGPTWNFAGYRYAHDCTFNYWYCGR
jgi:predicted RND superfamily exporter protein